MNNKKALVLSGDGLNCEQESAHALRLAGMHVEIMPLAHFIEQPKILKNYQVLLLPGGFSFGDECGSAAILALKLSHFAGAEISRFLERDVMVVGICNGFQALVRMNLLPDQKGERVSLTKNRQGHFKNNWVELQVAQNTRSLPLQAMKHDTFFMPMRHGEGRLVTQGPEHLKRLVENGNIAFTYKTDVNGSEGMIAGLCDDSGKILGMMPHPEAALDANYFAEAPLTRPMLGVGEDGSSNCLKLFREINRL